MSWKFLISTLFTFTLGYGYCAYNTPVQEKSSFSQTVYLASDGFNYSQAEELCGENCQNVADRGITPVIDRLIRFGYTNDQILKMLTVAPEVKPMFKMVTLPSGEHKIVPINDNSQVPVTKIITLPTGEQVVGHLVHGTIQNNNALDNREQEMQMQRLQEQQEDNNRILREMKDQQDADRLERIIH